MAIEAITNSAMTYQQGSKTGNSQIKAVEHTEVEPEKTKPEINVRQPEDFRIVEFESVQTEEEDSLAMQDTVSDKEQPEIMKGNEAMRKAVEEINKNATHSEAIFGIHEETNRVTIKIVDKDSKEVLKEFPPEKTLDMIAKVWEMAGLMVDQKL